MRYLFEYLFCLPGKTGAKALKGTIYHKCHELRAQASTAIREKKKFYIDDNFNKVLVKNAIDPEWCLDQAFAYYTEKEPDLNLAQKDKDEIKGWIDDVLEKYPNYDPLNMDILQTEQKFDIEIKEDWAKYKGVIKGVEYEGYLSIKGTIDSIIRLDDNTYEMLDLKTGSYRSDFATGEEKDLEYLKNDIQLLMYLLALDHLYPGKHWILSLFYIRAGGIFSVHGDANMLQRAKDTIKKYFLEISDCTNPTQFDPTNKDWRCKHLCPFAKPESQFRGQSMCQHYKGLIDRKGLEVVQDSMINEKKLFNYQSGGGRSAE